MVRKGFLPNKREGEKIIATYRKHWFIFLKVFFLYAILFLVPLAAYFLLNEVTPDILIGDLSQPILLVVCFTYYLAMLVFIFSVWTEKYLDVWTLTNERIISREQHGLFDRIVSELELHNIQDITAEQKGFFATFLNFGDIYIQSAGEVERFVFSQVPRPYQLANLIERLDEESKKNSPHHLGV